LIEAGPFSESKLGLRLGRGVRATAENFSLEKTVERWLELYGRAMPDITAKL